MEHNILASIILLSAICFTASPSYNTYESEITLNSLISNDSYTASSIELSTGCSASLGSSSFDTFSSEKMKVML